LARDEDLFDDLYREQRDPLVRLAYLLTGSQPTAEDLVQDVFIRSRDRLADLDQPAAYLRRSVTNACWSWHRRRKREAEHGRERPAVVAGTYDIEMWDALSRLAPPPPQRAGAPLLPGPARGRGRRHPRLAGRHGEVDGPPGPRRPAKDARGMNDDELVDRLRRTLRAEAEALTPGRGTPRVSGHRPRRDRTLGIPNRLIVGVTAAAVVAAAVAVAVSLHHGPTQSVSVIGPANRPPVPRPTRPSIPIVAVPAPTTTTTTTTTPAPPDAVPVTSSTTVAAPIVPVVVPRLGATFVPLSVTFVSASVGWVLGVASCPSATCLRLGFTDDHGQTWEALAGAPAADGLALPSTSDGRRPDLSIRFADARDGWISGNLGGSPVMWATHDGGATWTPVALPGAEPGASLDALEASAGRVDAVLASAGGTFVVDTSIVGADAWTTAVTLPAGARSDIASATLVLQGVDGWVVGTDGKVVSGARTASGIATATGWTTWNPPCRKGDGPAYLAASAPTDLVAVCEEGLYGPAADAPAGTSGVFERVFTSGDSGATFTAGAVVPAADRSDMIASPSAGVIVGAASGTSGTLVTSADGGATWSTSWRDPAATITQVGFEDATQGVAVAATPTGAELLMTSDAGAGWEQVDLQG
jgi:hypothetical protein